MPDLETCTSDGPPGYAPPPFVTITPYKFNEFIKLCHSFTFFMISDTIIR